MNSDTSALDKLIIVFSAILVITFLSCKDDPVAPEESKPVDATTIGTGGGTIQKGDFTLTIPPDALDKNYDISVSEIDDDGAFGDNTVTPAYKISGLPDGTNKSLIVKLKYNGTLSNNSYLIVDTETKTDSLISSSLFKASDSSGYMITSISNFTGNGYGALLKLTKINDNSSDKVIRGVTDFIEQESSNFVFYIPSSLSGDVNELKNNCENTLNFIKEDIGLSFFPSGNTRNVVLRKNTWNLLYSVIGAEFGIQVYFYADISKVINKKFDPLNADLGALLFELESPREKFDTKHFIFRSFKYIIKELIYEDGDFIFPLDFDKNKYEPFYGWAKENTDNSAIGFTPILKYLISDSLLSIAGIGETFQKVYEGSSLQHALISSVSLPIKDWLPNFFKKYVNSELYNFPANYFLNNNSEEWNINTAIDTLKTFTSNDVGKYQDLSAKIFKINLNYPEFESTQKLSLLISGSNYNEGLSLVLFSIKDNKVEYIGTSNETGAELEDLKGFNELGTRQFLVILVNSNVTSDDYSGESDIDLTMKINSKNSSGQSDLDYNLCRIEVYCQGLFENTEWAAGTQMEYSFRVSTDHSYYDYADTVTTITGSFNGNIFTGTFNDNQGWTQTASVTLNEAHNTVLNYSFQEEHTTYYYGSGDTEVNKRRASGNSVPISSTLNSRFEVKGINACGSISDIFDSRIRTHNNTSDTLKVVDHWCDANSRVIIQFYKK